MINNEGLTEEQLKKIGWALYELRKRITCLPDYNFTFKEKTLSLNKDDNGEKETHPAI